MAENAPTQNLTLKQQQTALMVAEDVLADEVIAANVGVSRFTLVNWKKRPDFSEAVAAHKAAFRERIMATGFADQAARVKALNTLAEGTLAELAKPAGFYREEVKIAANGEHVSYQVFDKPKHDTFRGYLDDIAKEMGDRKTVAEVSGKDGGALILGLVGVDLERV